MTPDQQAAYVIAQAACVTADIAAMQAENAATAAENQEVKWDQRKPIPWKGSDFRDLINAYGIHHNAVIGMFHR